MTVYLISTENSKSEKRRERVKQNIKKNDRIKIISLSL